MSDVEYFKDAMFGKKDRSLKAVDATLRDYFAAKAMAATLAHLSPESVDELADGIAGFSRWSHAAYVIADAMLAERAK